MRNLAQLNQWFRRHSSIGDRLRFLRAYLRWRNEYEHAFEHARPLGMPYEDLVQALVRAANKHARRLWVWVCGRIWPGCSMKLRPTKWRLRPIRAMFSNCCAGAGLPFSPKSFPVQNTFHRK